MVIAPPKPGRVAAAAERAAGRGEPRWAQARDAESRRYLPARLPPPPRAQARPSPALVPAIVLRTVRGVPGGRGRSRGAHADKPPAPARPPARPAGRGHRL